ncbi:MAG: DUF3800 domain-containing protein [Thermodesulfovibrionales bacterium]
MISNNVYNLYCDESRVENRDSKLMVIGVIEIPRKEKSAIIDDLKIIYEEHHFAHELKWTKVHNTFFPFYKRLIDYFLSNPLMQFRCIIVDKTKVDFEHFHDNDEELAFFKFYYLLLKEKLLSNNEYYIFLDKKPTRDRHRARALHAYLDSFILWNRKKCNIKGFHAIESKENMLIQFTDYLVGLAGFSCNEMITGNNAKGQLVQYLKEHLQREELCRTTALSEKKFNVFVWESRS